MTELFCLNIGQKEITSENSGNKGYMLSHVAPFTTIPKGFIVTTTAFDTFLKTNELQNMIIEFLDKLNEGKISIVECFQGIKEKIEVGVINQDIMLEIQDHLTTIKYPVVIRSSATAEDTKELSFAGLFDSFLSVETLQQVEKKIKQIYASLFNERVLQYSKDYQLKVLDIKMAVVIQEMVIGDKFGVGFYFQDQKKEPIYIVESSIGDPAAVTGGIVKPDTYIIRKDEIYKYSRQLNLNSLFEFEIKRIVRLMQELERAMFPLDIEWGFDKGQLFLLQIRPLTRKIPIPKGRQLLNGLTASPGNMCGNAVIWKGQKKLEQGNDKILVAEEVEIKDIAIIKNFGGIILEISGLTSHAAILAREFGIPCIVGIDGITNIVKPNEKICIDGNLGKISFQEREGFSIERKYTPYYYNPKDFRYFRWKNDSILYYLMDSFTIIFHAGLKEGLNDLLLQLKKEIKIPLVDGGVDVWYGYSKILEMSQLNNTIYQDFLNALEVVETADLSLMKETIERINSLIRDYSSEAKIYLERYKETENSKYLVKALQSVEFAFAYWKIIGHCMLYDYAENMLSTKDIPNKAKIQDFINTMEENSDHQAISKMVVDLINKILNVIKIDLKLDFALYSSVISFMSKISSL
ncbi:MAG: PEP/pyruvate-binding domain-containing protein [Promethearchaeota archaeon]